MDLLAGYGSGDSDSEGQSDREASPKHSSLRQKPATKSSLFSSLPYAKTNSVAVRSSAPTVGHAPTAFQPPRKTSTLPSDFDPPISTGNTLPPLPADFFDSAPKSAPAARPSSPPVLGPSKPVTTAPQDDDIAPPSSSLWSKLPAPKNSRRNVVSFTLPVKSGLLKSTLNTVDDDDLDRPAKRPKPTSGKSSLFDFLPAPKHASASSATLDLSEPSSKPSTSNQAPLQTLEAPIVGPSMYNNDFYRVDTAQESSYPSASEHPSTGLSHTNPHDPTYYDPSAYTAEQYGSDAAQAYYNPGSTTDQAYYDPSGLQPPGPGATPEEEDIFQQALKAERERAAKRGAGAAAGDIKFVELTQQDLKYVPPAKQESHNALQNALGSEYAMEIRSRAKAYMGSKMARRKHQIGTLFHNAKMMELEMMEQRAQSMKTKAETAAKYGW